MDGGNMRNSSEASYDYLEERFQELTALGSPEKKATFLVRDELTGKIFVKKYLFLENADIYERLKEARHRNLVRIYYMARKERMAFVIMEYVGGLTVEQFLQDGALFLEGETAGYLRQLFEGLEEIHKRGIVHRDISPKNLLISTDGVLKILDFDIGRLYKKGRGCDTEILGTAGYAAPEQFGFAQSDKRSDIFAAGVVANKMVTGAMPQERLYVKGKLGEMICTCTQIDPEKRYQSAGEALLEISSYGISMDAKKEGGDLFFRGAEKPREQSVWPGFRSGKKWKKAIALTYYIFMAVYSAANVAECAKTPLAAGLETAAVILYIWLSVFLPFNFLHWMEKTPGIRNLGKGGKKALGVFLWIFLIGAGAELEKYVQIEMLHLVKT